jgi:hypothetical protein
LTIVDSGLASIDLRDLMSLIREFEVLVLVEIIRDPSKRTIMWFLGV